MRHWYALHRMLGCEIQQIDHMVQLLNLGILTKIKNTKFDPHELCCFRTADSGKNRPHWHV